MRPGAKLPCEACEEYRHIVSHVRQCQISGSFKHRRSAGSATLMPECARQAKFSIFCSHVEDQLVDMKNLITPGISKVTAHRNSQIFAVLGAGDKMERCRSKGKSEGTVSLLRDRLFRMYRPANQQVDYVKCFNKLLGRVRPSLHPVGFSSKKES